MMNSRILSLLLTLAISFTAHSQGPGYQGKHLILGAEIGGMPVVGAIISNDRLIDLNERYSLKLEYVVSKSIAIGMKLHRSEDIIALSNVAVSTYSPLQLSINSDLFGGGTKTFTSAANFSYTGFGPFIKIYNQAFGSIAPLGQYFTLEYQYGNINVFDDGRFYNNAQTEIHSMTVHNFVVGGGIQNIFFNRLTVDLSINLGINIPGALAFGNDKEYIGEGGNKLVRQIEKKAFADQFLCTKIGFGWLLF